MSRHRPLSLALMILLAAGLLTMSPPGSRRAGAAPAPAVKEEDLLERARHDGKYRLLLRQIKVDKDEKTYGAFRDLGYRNRRTYAGHTDLPRGWWVYAYPYWYIWRDLASVERPKRAWGPEQATGEPDTTMAGDIQTAWASQTPDGQDEWLMLEYDKPVVPTAVLVHETYNPGALVRVTVFKLDGTEVEVWKGADPTAAGTDKGVSEIPVKVNFKVARVKIYLDSRSVAGWNEIDAVGLRDQAKKMHWAVAAHASSTYAPPYPEKEVTAEVYEERISALEEEVRQLKAALAEMKEALKKKDR
jgi:hypothetical protein